MTTPKYKLGDVVYFIYNDKPIKTFVTKMRYVGGKCKEVVYGLDGVYSDEYINEKDVYKTPQDIIAHLLT